MRKRGRDYDFVFIFYLSIYLESRVDTTDLRVAYPVSIYSIIALCHQEILGSLNKHSLKVNDFTDFI